MLGFVLSGILSSSGLLGKNFLGHIMPHLFLSLNKTKFEICHHLLHHPFDKPITGLNSVWTLWTESSQRKQVFPGNKQKKRGKVSLLQTPQFQKREHGGELNFLFSFFLKRYLKKKKKPKSRQRILGIAHFVTMELQYLRK